MINISFAKSYSRIRLNPCGFWLCDASLHRPPRSVNLTSLTFLSPPSINKHECPWCVIQPASSFHSLLFLIVAGEVADEEFGLFSALLGKVCRVSS